MLRRHTLVSIGSLTLLSGTALAQVDPNSGIDFVTIGAVGNAPFTSSVGNTSGYGQVNYEYKIGRFEVNTAQWVEFMNAALDRPTTDRIPHVLFPSQWQAGTTTPNNAGGRRYTSTPQTEMMPVGGVDWRTCAIYCNWLHNGKSLDRSAFLSGAYDVSTFGWEPNGNGFTDQITRSPGAQYWIPSQSEWMKAAHYDPNKQNTDGTLGGWWQYSNGSDTPYWYGPAGQHVGRDSGSRPIPDPNGPLAEANGGWQGNGFTTSPYTIPLGAYEHVQSPWGLKDVAGGTREWIERAIQFPGEQYPRSRYAEGSAWVIGYPGGDDVRGVGASEIPIFNGFDYGFRIASIPSPSAAVVAGFSLALMGRRKRSWRRCEQRQSSR
jgi:sulfatase modifying factor 1